MRLITADHIQKLAITPRTCVEWVTESFLMKERAHLPAKISLHPQGNDFFNTMPCLLPEEYHRYCVKVVSRIEGAIPTLCSRIFLYNSATGEMLCMMDGDWVTTMRTGAVATLAARTLRREGEPTYGFAGLGNTARATLLCLLDCEPETNHHVLLLRYKDQAENFMKRFEEYPNVSFEIVDNCEQLVAASDVLFSCITNADGLLCPNDSLFRPGCLIIPVHTKGFQNCDLFFDRVMADDTAHVCGFKYFNQFHGYAELSDVLSGKDPGRTSDRQRILSYNIGLGLHDAVFATKINDLLLDAPEIAISKTLDKFWI